MLFLTVIIYLYGRYIFFMGKCVSMMLAILLYILSYIIISISKFEIFHVTVDKTNFLLAILLFFVSFIVLIFSIVYQWGISYIASIKYKQAVEM